MESENRTLFVNPDSDVGGMIDILAGKEAVKMEHEFIINTSTIVNVAILILVGGLATWLVKRTFN